MLAGQQEILSVSKLRPFERPIKGLEQSSKEKPRNKRMLYICRARVPAQRYSSVYFAILQQQTFRNNGSKMRSPTR